MKPDVDYEEFKSWLSESSLLSKKATGDVISRLRRSDRIFNLINSAGYKDYVGQISQCSEFQDIPPSSKNSMLRSVKLYYQFLSNKK